MKYLKRFNEDITSFNFEEELKDFCETNLAYLLDEAELSIVESPGGYQDLILIRIELNETKTWVEIKDHMIPFLTRLNNKYEITSEVFDANFGKKWLPVKGGNIRFYWLNESYVETSIEDLISDEPNSVSAIKLYRYSLDDIRIYIKKEQPKKSVLTKIKSFFK